MDRHLQLTRWAFVLVAVTTGCDDDLPPEPERTCATDIGVGEVQPFGDDTEFNTEGLTFDAQGALFVSRRDGVNDDQLLQVMEDGTYEVVAEAESILGLASDESGILAAGIETGNLLVIDPADGTNEVLASGLGAPNFVVTTPWDTFLVSDDTFGEDAIDEVTREGVASTWVTGIPTPNGMVFSLDGSELYVATTFEEPGLWRIPIMEGGVAGAPEKWIEFATATTPDGVAIDTEGNVYVALNLAAEIARVDPEGNVTTLASLRSPASLAFGQGGFDPCSLYVSSLFGTQLWRVGTGVLGVEKQGLPLRP